MPFQDVSRRACYYRAVLWAVENNITSGTTPTTFSPENPVQRGDMLTFLWAAFGREFPEETENPFSDVRAKRYYYRAVIWAVANDILVGNEGGDRPDKLCPKAPCTRAYAVTYLYCLFRT